MILNKKLLYVGILCLILSPMNLVGLNSANSRDCKAELPSVVLNTFLVDLDKLYMYDNLTMRNKLLNEIGNGSYGWPLTPYGAHFASQHIEGVDHVYFHPYRILPMFAPHDGVFDSFQSHLGNETVMQNGTEVIYDSHLSIDIGEGCYFHIGHISLLKSIYDVIQATGSYSFSEGEIIGYNHANPWGNYGFEIYYHAGGMGYGGGFFYPLKYFSSTIQDKIEDYYNQLLPRAKIGGAFPEVAMYNDIYVAIESSVWGVWKYKSGYLDSYFEIGSFNVVEGRYTTFFNRNFTNTEYYYRDPKNPDLNITEDVLGIFGNSRGTTIIEEFNITTHGFLKTVEGDFSNGIMEVVLNSAVDDWGFANDSIYVRYNVDSNSTGFRDDILTVECFKELASAQAGFTEYNLTYARYILSSEFEDPNPLPTETPTPTTPTTPTNSSNGYWIIPFTSVLVAMIIINKRKKWNENYKK
ncbi:MAG: hypothetical protein ACTSPM_14280 [Candidatus Heimdallarchaeota archaeon]